LVGALALFEALRVGFMNVHVQPIILRVLAYLSQEIGPLIYPPDSLPTTFYEAPLSILGMVASPIGLPELDVEREKRLVEEALNELQEGGLVELTWLEGQTWSELQQAMWGDPWHVFHFVGHGGFDPVTEEGAIALSDQPGRKHLLRARNLARLIDGHYPLRPDHLDDVVVKIYRRSSGGRTGS